MCRMNDNHKTDELMVERRTAWWDDLAAKCDPMKIPGIVDLAFEAGWMAGGQGLGPTGQFPAGKADANDEGEIRFGIALGQDGLVHLNFGKPIAYFALPPQGAVELAKLLLRNAGAKRVEVQF